MQPMIKEPVIKKHKKVLERAGFINLVYSNNDYDVSFTNKDGTERYKIITEPSFPLNNKIRVVKNDIELITDTFRVGRGDWYESLPTLDNKIGILILCHPKKVTATLNPLVLENHWWGSSDLCEGTTVFNYIFSKFDIGRLKGTPVVDTIDLYPGGTFADDAFNDKFINSHLNEYTLILVPDCGGKWVEFQYQKNKKDEYNETAEICFKLTNMLKKNGLIVFSKFLDSYFYQYFLTFFKEKSDIFQLWEYDVRPVRNCIVLKKL